MSWFETRKNKQKGIRLRKIEEELQIEIESMGLYHDAWTQENRKENIPQFARKSKKRGLVEERLVPEEIKSKSFDEFLNKYKKYRENRLDFLDDMDEKIKEMNELGMKTNKVMISVNQLNETIIYTEGKPYIETEDLDYDQLLERIRIMRNKNKKRFMEKQLVKKKNEVEQMTIDEWEKGKGGKKRKFSEQIDVWLEEVMNQNNLFDRLQDLVAKDLEIIKQETLEKAKNAELV